MRKQTYTIIVGIVLAAFALYTRYRPVTSPREQVSSASIQYDKSVKTVPGQPIKVVRVIDGDTIELINGEHLRYIGIDTPEEVDPQKPGVQCYAREAAQRNKELVEGQTITFQKDVSTYDKYGRWLGFVYLPDGTMVNDELVKEGFAFSYPYKPDITKQSIFDTDQTYAKQNKLGLWASCIVSTLSTGREQTNWLSQ